MILTSHSICCCVSQFLPSFFVKICDFNFNCLLACILSFRYITTARSLQSVFTIKKYCSGVSTTWQCSTCVLNLDLELYRNESIDSELTDLLSSYQYAFSVNLEEKTDEIKGLINKISNVKQISGFYITYQSESGKTLDDDEVAKLYEELDSSYFEISYIINSRVQTVGI